MKTDINQAEVNIHCPPFPWLEGALRTGSLESVLRSHSRRDKRLRLLRRLLLIDGEGRLRTVREWKTALDLLPSKEEIAFEVLWDRMRRSRRPRGRPTLEQKFRRVLVVECETGDVLLTDELQIVDQNSVSVRSLTEPVQSVIPFAKTVLWYRVGGCDLYWIKLNDVSAIDLERAIVHIPSGSQAMSSVHKSEALDHVLSSLRDRKLFIGRARFDELSSKDAIIEDRYIAKYFGNFSPEEFFTVAQFAARALSWYKPEIFRDIFGFPMPELGKMTRQYFLNFMSRAAPYHYDALQHDRRSWAVDCFYRYTLPHNFQAYVSRLRSRYGCSLLEAATLFGVTNVGERHEFHFSSIVMEDANERRFDEWYDGLTKTDRQGAAWTVNVAPDSFLFALVLLRRDLLQTMLTVLRDYDYQRTHSAAERLATEHYIPLLGLLLELLGRHGVESARDLPPEQQAKFVALALSELMNELPNSVCLSWPKISLTRREDVRPAFLDNSSVFFLFRWYVPDRLPSDWRDRFSCINDHGFRCPGEAWIKKWLLSELYNELKNPHLLTIS
jgi:hypothetical protein